MEGCFVIRIVIGGLQKDLIKKQVEETGGDRVEAVITSDFEGAKKVKAGQADYYVGACNSGGGAALSVAIGLLGYNRCATIAKAGGRPDPQEIEKRVQEGKIAFGMSVEAIESTVPILVRSLLEHSDK